MSVSTLVRKEQFVLDGVEDEYTFTFRALTSAPEDIKCYVTTAGTDTILTYTTQYSVSINSDGIGGTVTLVSAGTIGLGTLTVYRETTLKQESDYDDYNQFPANTLEENLDQLMAIVQEHAEELDRSVKLSITSTLTSSTGFLLPTPVAGRALKWNDAADSLKNTDVDIDTAIASTLASQVAAATSATTATNQATAAANSATSAATYSTTATAAATTATTQANAATTYATTAQSAATTSTTQATAASTSATTAASHATTALTASTTATTQATAAVTSATTAASHATTALTASTTATTQATLAGNYATTASTQAIAAATSATTALTAQTAAEATVAIPINTQTGNYTLVLTDVNKMVDLNTSGACTLTIPSSGAVAIPTGSVILIRQLGAGQVTITTAATVTINKETGLKTTGQYALAGLLKTGTDAWLATGALEA